MAPKLYAFHLITADYTFRRLGLIKAKLKNKTLKVTRVATKHLQYQQHHKRVADSTWIHCLPSAALLYLINIFQTDSGDQKEIGSQTRAYSISYTSKLSVLIFEAKTK